MKPVMKPAMKVVILAGGFGERLAEETDHIPKPLIEIGGKPILWHVMKHYAHHGLNEFVIAAGYKANAIKSWLLDILSHETDMSFDFSQGTLRAHRVQEEPWKVDVIDTGLGTTKSGRLRRVAKSLHGAPFMVSYGDSLCDVNIGELLTFHRDQGCIATVCAVPSPPRYGRLFFDGDRLTSFAEKPIEGWVNGGFFVFEPEIFESLNNDALELESDVLERLVREQRLAAFRHPGFWQSIDTPYEKRLLNQLWESGSPPWRTWA